MKNKNIQSPKYDTKYQGKGRLVKRNKVLISVLTTSVFLFPVFSASAESISFGGNNLNQLPLTKFMNEINSLNNQIVDRNMTITDNPKNPQNAPMDPDSNYFTIRGYKNVAATEFYTISIPKGPRKNNLISTLKVIEWSFVNGEYILKNEKILKPGDKVVYNSKEFGFQSTAKSYWFRSIDTKKTLIINYEWQTRYITEKEWINNGYNPDDPTAGVIYPGEVKVNVSFTDNLGQKMMNESNQPMDDESYSLINGQGYKYNTEALPKIPGYTLKAPDNSSQNLENEAINKIDIKYVYEFDKEAHKPKFTPVLEGRSEVNGQGIPGDKIVITDSKGNKIGEGTVDENGNFKIKTSRPLIKGENLTATPSTGKQQGTVSTVPVQEDIYTKELEKVAADTKELIKNDLSLTEKEKKEQQNAVDEKLKLGKENISKAVTEDELSNTVKDGSKSIKDEYKAGKPLDDQKATAIENLNKVILETKEAINNDLTLTKAEKEKQIKAVETTGELETKAINNTKNADDLKLALETGTKNVKAEHKPGSSVEDQKNQTKATLDKVIADTKEAIQKDPTLTNDEKEKQIKAVETTGELAKDALEDIKNAEDLKLALEAGTSNIEAEHKPGSSVEDQKNQAKETLDKVINDTKAAIEKDLTLTNDEKEKQKNAVDTTGKAAKDAIDRTNTADELKVAIETGTSDIKAEHKPGSSVEDQKNQAKENLDKVINDTKAAIEADVTLTKAEKEKQKNAVETTGKAATKAINETNNAEDLKVAIETGTKNVQAEYKPGSSVEDQKNQAKATLDKVINDTKAAIKADPTLTNDEKEKQINAVDTTGAKATKAINDTNNAEDLKLALETGTSNIEAEHKPGTSVEDQKNQAKATLDKVINDTKAAIEADPTLTTAEKEKQKNAVDTTGKTAKDAIDHANTADELNAATEAGTAAIIKEHVSGNGLDVRKETAKGIIDKEVENTKKAIANDPTLTEAEKEKQAQAAIEEGEKAKEAIDAATDANGIDSELAKGIEKISNQHKSGNAVDVRKDDAKKAIDQEAKIIKEKIANDPTLTKEEKERQSGKVDQEATKAKEAIDTATTADGIDEAKGKGIELIDNQYQPGSALVGRKEDAKKVIDEEAKIIKEKITNDSTLTKEEKERQSGKVDQEATKAKEAIDAATNADGVDDAKGKGIELIDNQYQPGSSLDSRKEDAKKAIDQEAAFTKEQIQNDPSLTNEEKAEQAGKVDQEATKAKTAIDEATTADGVDEAKGKGIELTDNQYQPGSSLVSRKEDAKKVIDQEATLIKDRITNDPTLTNEEKANQIGTVDQEAEKAKATIDGATDASGVDSAKGKGIELIDNQYQTGNSLDNRKESAKDAIDREAAFTVEQITNDRTLTAEEKATQINGVNQEATNAKHAIDAATDASGVDNAKGKGIELIDSQYQPGISITDRQNAAKDAIDQEAALTKDRIKNDPTLTDAEKVEQSNRVDQEATNAKVAIDAATDANDVDVSKGQGITNIDNQYQTSQPLDERKEAAKAGIDQAANDAKNRIKNDPTLTAEEKATQSSGVDQAAINAKAGIDSATDASGVDSEKGQGITTIDSNYQPGSSLDSRKETAKAGIDQAAKEAKDKIANDPTLTAEEKATQSNGVDEAATNAKTAIDAAKDANGVDREKGQGVTNIDNNYQPGSGLDGRKDLAKFDIDEAAKATKEKINNDSTLTTEEKVKQSNGVDEAATKAKEAIDAATDASGVDSAKGQGITTIDNNYQPGNPLDSRKETAKAGIDAEAVAIKEKITNDAALTDKEKETQIKGVEEAATKAKEAIDAATDANGVDSAKGQGITTIDNNYQPGSQLDSRKEDAKKAIDEAAKATKEKINNDSTLTDKEKEKQSKGVDEAAEAAKKAIDAAKNADGVDSAKGQGITTIDNNYQPGSQLDGRKEDAKKAIDDAAKATKEKINNDSTLTKEEKTKQNKGVEAAAEAAKKAIDTAKNADGVDSAKGQGITNIDKQYQTGDVLDLRKENAKKAIDEAAKATKEAIAKDTTLTAKEKEAQTKAVDAEAKKAKEAIDAAKNSDEVDSAKGQGISDINKQHESGKSVEVQKEAAKKAIDEAAKATKEAIAKDATLTAKEKEAQTKAVDAEATKAKEAIEAAKTVDEVNSAKDKGVTDVNKQHKSEKVIEAQKEAAKKAIDEAAKATKEAIAKDATLTAKEKEAQTKAVDAEATKAKEAIEAAKTVDEVNSAKDKGVTDVNKQHESGKSVEDQKEAAKKAIDDAAKATKEAIAKDTTLTAKEKEAQTKAVDAEATKAKEAIDAAKTVDEVNSTKDKGVSDVNKQHESGKSVEDQKEAAKKAIDDAAKATKEAIAKDKTLTAKEKEAQTKAVDAEATKAKEAIDAAKTVDEVRTAVTTGEKEIAKKHVQGKKLEEQKEEAKKELETIAEKTKDVINKDPKLTVKEKETQIKAVNVALEKAKKAIDEAKDADTIAKVKVEAITLIENQYKPGNKTSGGNSGNGNTGNGNSTGGKGTSSGGGYTSGTTGNTGRSTLPKTGSEQTGYLAGLVGFALSGLALLGFRKKHDTEEE